MKIFVKSLKWRWESCLSFLGRGIPEISAEALGLYRFALGILLFIAFIREIQPVSRAYTLDQLHGLAKLEAIAWLSHHLEFVTFLYHLSLIATFLFAIGVFPRFFYGLVASGFLLQVLLRNGGHEYTVLLTVLFADLAVPWGEGLGVNTLLERLKGKKKQAGATTLNVGTRYGFAVWIPSFCLGTAFAAAGVAKLVLTENRWITQAGVRHGLLEDAFQAPSELGLFIVNHWAIAVFFSLMAVVVEVAFLIIPFTKHFAIALAFFGLGALPLLVGFYALMGIFWWQWWFLVPIAFVPWSKFLNFPKPSQINRDKKILKLTNLQIAIILGIIFSQIIFSVLETEFVPLFSNYPMYANAFPRTEDNQMLEKLVRLGRDKKFTAKLLSENGSEIPEKIEASNSRSLYRQISEMGYLNANFCHAYQKKSINNSPAKTLLISIDRQLILTPEKGFVWKGKEALGNKGNIAVDLANECRSVKKQNS